MKSKSRQGANGAAGESNSPGVEIHLSAPRSPGTVKSARAFSISDSSDSRVSSKWNCSPMTRPSL